MFFRTVMCGQSAYDWKTMPRLRLFGGTLTPRVGVEHGPVAEPDAALLGRLQTGDAAQGRGLAATTRPEKDEELARLDLEIEVVDRHHRRLAAESLGQAAHAYVGQPGHPPSGGGSGATSPRSPAFTRSPTYGWKRAFQRAWNAAIFAGVKFFRFGTRGGTKIVSGAPGITAPA